MQAQTADDREAADPAPLLLDSERNDQSMSINVGEANFSVSADGHTVYVNGGIGRGFFDDLKNALQANRFVQRVVITSGGGYAGPGLEAA